MPSLNWLTRIKTSTLRHGCRTGCWKALDLSGGEQDAGNLLIQGDNLEALLCCRSMPGR